MENYNNSERVEVHHRRPVRHWQDQLTFPLAPIHVDQSQNNTDPLQRAPKKPQHKMKKSRRKRIFGSIYKKKKKEMQASFLDQKENNDPTKVEQKKRTFSKISNERKSAKMRDELSANFIPNPQVQGHENPAKRSLLGANATVMNMFEDKKETATEVSLLTMSSPQAVFRKTHRRDVLKDKVEEINRTTSQSDFYASRGNIFFNKSSSNANARDHISSSSNSSSSDSDEDFSGFMLELEPIVVVASNLSANSSDCSSSEESSEGSCSVSTSASHLYEHIREQIKEGSNLDDDSKYKRVMNDVKGVMASYSDGMKLVLSSCFAPTLNSPHTKQKNLDAFLRAQR